MNDTTIKPSSYGDKYAVKEFYETPSQEIIRVVDQFFYGIGILGFTILTVWLVTA